MRVVDGFVNPILWPWDDAPAWVREAIGVASREAFETARARTPEALVELMDASGVDHAIANAPEGMWDAVSAVVAAHPGRFSFSVEVDPRRGMEAVRAVRRAVGDHGAVLVRMVPFLVGLPPSDRIYYPVFATCAELGIPVALNTGIPAPRMPAEPQRPLHLDDVVRFFPELDVIMQHGADPWWDEATRLLLKYPNLYLMTSAWAPRYLPPALLEFMNTRGRDKVLFGSDYPALSFERCLREARALELRPGVLDSYLSGAADALFGARIAP